MNERGFVLFDTAIGTCGIAWGGRGIVGVQLPEGRSGETRARVLKRFPDAREGKPPREVQAALEAIVALMRGEKSDLTTVPLDMEGLPPFHRRVYEVARSIPAGATISYGDIARRLGAPQSARAVGQALGRNPFAIVVPCHRVLAAGGRVGGFSASGGVTTKLRMLTIEGAHDHDNVQKNGQKNREPAGRARPTAEPAFPFDPAAAVAHLRAADPTLAALMERVGPFQMRLDRRPSIFVALAEAIVYQQLTAKAAATIFARVRALFARPHEGPTAEQILRASDQKLRGAGLSAGKLLALRDLASKARAGEIPTLEEVARLEDEAIVERLTAVRGIGRWTVQMLLMFRLGRPDVLPVDDYGIRKGFASAYRKRKLPLPRDLDRYGNRWRPYRTVASWYLWRALDLTALAKN
jgi:methylated-DNA-[protein]-cysteine S-methyltransferase